MIETPNAFKVFRALYSHASIGRTLHNGKKMAARSLRPPSGSP
jgi:hypothetical protein